MWKCCLCMRISLCLLYLMELNFLSSFSMECISHENDIWNTTHIHYSDKRMTFMTYIGNNTTNKTHYCCCCCYCWYTKSFYLEYFAQISVNRDGSSKIYCTLLHMAHESFCFTQPNNHFTIKFYRILLLKYFSFSIFQHNHLKI